MKRFLTVLVAGLALVGIEACHVSAPLTAPPATPTAFGQAVVELPATPAATQEPRQEAVAVRVTALPAPSVTGTATAIHPLPEATITASPTGRSKPAAAAQAPAAPDTATPAPALATAAWTSTAPATRQVAPATVAASVTPAPPAAATPTPGQPEALPPGVAGQIDALFAEWDRPGSPGCSLGLGEAGRLIYGRGYGQAELQHGVPITTETVFNAGSIAKQVTGLSIELLREEGRLRLDDPLHLYVPELPAYAEDITLRQMLAHTSGLRDDRTLALMAGMADDELLSQPYLVNLILRQQDTNFPPNQKFSYSNSNFSLLAMIVQRVSGQPIAQFAGERLFGPLGMAHTGFAADPMAVVPGRALAYARAGNDYQLSLPNAALPGPTDLYTTAADLVRWADNYSSARAGNRAGLAAALQPAYDSQGRKVAYNFGLEQKNFRDLGPTLEHDGIDGGFRSELLFWPQQRRAVAVLCNLEEADAKNLAEQAARLWRGLPALPPTPQPTPRPTVPVESYVTLPPGDLAGRAGVYYDPGRTRLLRLYVDGSRLRVDGLPDLELAALAPDRFRIFSAGQPTPGEARFPSTGSALEIKNSLSFTGSYRRYPDLAAAPDYSGTYYSPELDTTYRISLERGVLTLDSRRFVNIALLPLDGDAPGTLGPRRFEMAKALPPITVEFAPGAGPITGFALSLDRARGVRFDKR